ncbi:hypothetical protein CBR_g38078 [Chara braunii]|uniref:Reverse transcriptase domain-containing protein n=1 Tax=Chara braunii TaxID=69332 RepID=A0A388K064_CHABU|nr:hypothetical protein CBR_g38078 [Chara braunii]|eukprot:GBG63460.1 hypothetical protein CBR_g38078 [Chara braunii]
MPTSASATNPRIEALALMEKRKEIEVEIEIITSRLCKPGGPGLKGDLIDREGFPRADIDIPAARADRHRLAVLHYDHRALTEKIEKLIYAFHATIPPTPQPPKTEGGERRRDSSAAATTSSSSVLPVKRAADGEDVRVSHSQTDEHPQAEPSARPSLTADRQMQEEAGGAEPMQSDGAGRESEGRTSSHREVLRPFAFIDEVAEGSPGQIDGMKVGDHMLRFGSVTAGPDCIRRVAEELQAMEGRAVQTEVLRRGSRISLMVMPRPWADSAALLAASCTSGEDANVASPRYTYEDYAVHLVPPLDQPLYVQQSTACTVSSPSATDSPQSIAGDSTSWSRLDELDPLTFTDFQWMPVPSTGRLPKPHCNVLMAQLRDYLHTAVPTLLMDAGAEVVDLHAFIAKIDRKFKTQRYDDIDAPLLYIRIQIGEANCSALIDCGASRNYISQDFMVRTGLGPRVRRKSQPTQVTLADGHTHKSIDRCIDAVPVYFAPQASEAVSFDILDTKFDMILGMSWLRSKDHPMNFFNRTVHVRPHGVVPDRPIRHKIILEDGAVPPRDCIYRMSEEELSVLRAQLDDLLEKGWIRPSSSPYGAPVLFVRKKNKDLRLCIDYRKLNAQTIRNAGPLPRIDDLLERLGGAQFFSKLDLKSGYHQLEIRKEDRYKTAFKTRYGHFEWLVMPFGLTNAPATFQAAMTTEFRHMLDRFVLIYLDDIMVYSRSLDEHVEHLCTVLERLRQAKYKANRDKCEFAQQELEYLGHYVTPQGIRPLADKIEALRVWPEPTNTMDVHSFMGLAGYYQRFITGYSRIAAPMTRLQPPKVPFVFDDDARRSFQALKTAMLMAPVLSIYDPTLPTCHLRPL